MGDYAVVPGEKAVEPDTRGYSDPCRVGEEISEEPGALEPWLRWRGTMELASPLLSCKAGEVQMLEAKDRPASDRVRPGKPLRLWRRFCHWPHS